MRSRAAWVQVFWECDGFAARWCGARAPQDFRHFAAPRARFVRAAFLFVSVVKTVIDSAMPVSEALCQILEQQFMKLRELENGARAPENVEAVHDMRVACRRLKSGFRFGRAYLPHKRVERLFPVLESLRDSLGAARNLDVQLAALSAYCAGASARDRGALTGLNTAWARARAEQQSALEHLLGDGAYADWAKRMESFLDTTVQEPGPCVAEIIPALLWKQYGRVRAYETHLAGAPMSTLHALRIEVKRLRYGLEFFRDPLTAPGNLAPRPNELIESLIALQDLLGEMQDAVVGGELAAEYLTAEIARDSGNAGVDEFHGVAAYQNSLHAQIQARRKRVPELYAALTGSWFRDSLGTVTARL